MTQVANCPNAAATQFVQATTVIETREVPMTECTLCAIQEKVGSVVTPLVVGGLSVAAAVVVGRKVVVLGAEYLPRVPGLVVGAAHFAWRMVDEILVAQAGILAGVLPGDNRR